MNASTWLAAALREVPAQALAWQGRARVLAALEPWVALQLERARDPAFGVGFAEGCPWPGALPADYLQRVVSFPGGQALVGIRFFGGSASFRFVDLLASTGPREPEALGSACAAALRACARFAPSAVRVLQPEERQPVPPGWGARVDQRFLAAPLAALRLSPEAALAPNPDPQPDPGLELELLEEPDQVSAAAEFVAAAYRAWGAQDPALAARVTPADAAELEACRATGLLAYLRWGSRRVGLIGLEADADAYLAGYRVVEEVVLLEARGRRLARRAQVLAASLLGEGEPEALLFGTIDGANLASLRSAEGAGRARVAAYRFLTPPS